MFEPECPVARGDAFIEFQLFPPVHQCRFRETDGLMPRSMISPPEGAARIRPGTVKKSQADPEPCLRIVSRQ